MISFNISYDIFFLVRLFDIYLDVFTNLFKGLLILTAIKYVKINTMDIVNMVDDILMNIIAISSLYIISLIKVNVVRSYSFKTYKYT